MAYASVADIRQYLDQVPETAEQTVTVSGASGGTLRLAYADAVAEVAYPATKSALQQALAALPPLAAYTRNDGQPIVKVRGQPGGPYRVIFDQPLGDDAEELVGDASGLTGAAPAVTVAPTTDGLLQACLDRATGMIDEVLQPIRFTGYSAPEARLIPGFGGTALWLPPHESGSVSAVSLGGTAITDYTYVGADGGPTAYLDRRSGWATTLPGRTWEWWLAQAPLGWPHDRDAWVFGRTGISGAYSVTARWGYGDPPASVEELCLELAVNIWRGRDRGMFTEVIGAEGGAMLRYTGALNKSQQAILQGVKDRLWPQAV